LLIVIVWGKRGEVRRMSEGKNGKMRAKQKEGKGIGEEISQNLVPDSLSSQK
jgi:hypothetical protein